MSAHMSSSMLLRSALRKTVYTPNKILITARYTCSVSPEPTDPSIFRANEPNPAQHREEHLTKYYDVDKDILDQHLPLAFPKNFKRQAKAFNEACMMIRRPALDVINSLKNTDYSKPPVRYVLYGKGGQGKTMSLAHILHYCYSQDWMIVHVPNGLKFIFNNVYSASNFRQGMYDQPKIAQEWLASFRTTNEKLLSDLTTMNRHQWNKKEKVELDTPLVDIIKTGMLKPERNASDAVRILLEELGAHSSAGKFRLLLAVDLVNALFNPRTALRRGRSFLKPEELTVIASFVKMLQADSWRNGAVVTAVDGRALYKVPPEQLKSLPPESQEFTVLEKWKMPAKEGWLPMHLLTPKGVDAMHPYVPVLVDKYDQSELASCFGYFIDRKWIQTEKGLSEQGRKELTFLSDHNPSVLYKICGAYA